MQVYDTTSTSAQAMPEPESGDKVLSVGIWMCIIVSSYLGTAKQHRRQRIRRAVDTLSPHTVEDM